METIERYRDFVKGQCEFHRRMANKHASDPRRGRLHMETTDTFKELYEFLDGLIQEKARKPQRLSLSWDELSDLPDELVAELSISDADRAEFNILSVIEDAGGIAALDRILVGYFRHTGEVVRRQQMINRIYRMIQKGLLYSVPGRKGVYSLSEISQEEAAFLPN
jgi:hypothetical protein